MINLKWYLLDRQPVCVWRNLKKEFVEKTGVKVIIEGGMGQTQNMPVRITAPLRTSPGRNAVVAKNRSRRDCGCLNGDLGMPETLWHCRVKEFGPLIVSIDTEGRNLFEENKVIFNERKIKQLKKYVNM